MGMGSLRSPTPPAKPGRCWRAEPRCPRSFPGEGVTLEDGTSIRAHIVISNADPKRTLGMLDGQEVEGGFRDRLERWKMRSPVVKFNAALDRLPNWAAAPGEDWPARATIDVTGTIDEAQRAFEAAERGEPAVAFGEIYIQTGYDPSPAPQGKHLLSVFGQYAPYELAGGGLGGATRRGRPPVHRIDRSSGAGLRGLPGRPRGPRPPRHRVEDRADRRQHLPGRGHARSDVGGTTGRADPGAGPLPVWGGDPSAGSVIALNGRNAAAAVLADAGVSGDRLERGSRWRLHRSRRARRPRADSRGRLRPDRHRRDRRCPDRARRDQGRGLDGARPPLLLDPRGAARAGADPFLREGRRGALRRPRRRKTATEGLAAAIADSLPYPGPAGTRLGALGRAMAARRPRAGAAPGRGRTCTSATGSGWRRVIRRGVESGEFRRVDPDERRRPGDGAVRRHWELARP